jgi:hypothetical protein
MTSGAPRRMYSPGRDTGEGGRDGGFPLPKDRVRVIPIEERSAMRAGGIGVSLLLIATGAILAWAVTAEAQGVNINMVGLIMLGVGVIGLIISLFANFTVTEREERDVTVVDR